MASARNTVFFLDDFVFTSFSFTKAFYEGKLNLDFNPQGMYFEAKKQFVVTFDFVASLGDEEEYQEIVKCRLNGFFEFEEPLEFCLLYTSPSPRDA